MNSASATLLSPDAKPVSKNAAQPGRGERVVLGMKDRPLLLIDESYNANTASMRAALEVLANIDLPKGRKVVVLGDMLELGAMADDLHAGLAEPVLASGAERVYLVGAHMAALAATLPPQLVAGHFASTAEAVDVIMDDLAYGDAIMIKGSNGVGLSRLVADIKTRFAQT